MDNTSGGAEYVLGNTDQVLENLSTRRVEKEMSFAFPFLNDTSRILDAGCGPGSITASLAKYFCNSEVIGIDYDSLQVDAAEKKYKSLGNVSFYQQSIDNLSFPDDFFDVVFVHTVLMHLASPVSALKELHRVCKPGGRIVVREGISTLEDLGDVLLEQSKLTINELLDRTLLLSGGTPNIGLSLKKYAIQAGFSVKHFGVSSVCYQSPEELYLLKEWYQSMITGKLGKVALKHELVSRSELLQLSQKLDALYLNPNAVSVTVWGELVAAKDCDGVTYEE